MSEPKRFDCLSDGMWQNSAGDYVLHSDYARLKAEVERLTAFTTRTIIPNEELQAQVDALRKELADAQESYHLVNEMVAKMLKERKQS